MAELPQETINNIYKKGRADVIDDAERELLANGFIYTEHALEVWHKIAEKLKVGGESEQSI